MVTCWWWYETAVRADSPSASCQSILPAGETLVVEQIPRESPDRVLCRLDREEDLRDVMIPRGAQVKSFELCKPTPFRVELSVSQIAEACEWIEGC